MWATGGQRYAPFVYPLPSAFSRCPPVVHTVAACGDIHALSTRSPSSVSWQCTVSFCRAGALGRLGLAHGGSFELNAVRIVQELVAQSIGLVRVADDRVPILDRELACDQGRGAFGSISDDLHEVAPFGLLQRG